MTKEIDRQIADLSVRIDALTREGFESYDESIPGGGHDFRRCLADAAPLIARRNTLRRQKERIENMRPATSTKIEGME
jgi:hypothetical protein